MKSIRAWKLRGISRIFRKFLVHVLEIDGEWILQDVSGHVNWRPNEKKEWTCWLIWKRTPEYRIQHHQDSPSFPLKFYREMSLRTKLKFWYYQTFYGYELTPYEINKKWPSLDIYNQRNPEYTAIGTIRPGNFVAPVYDDKGKLIGVKSCGDK